MPDLDRSIITPGCPVGNRCDEAPTPEGKFVTFCKTHEEWLLRSLRINRILGQAGTVTLIAASACWAADFMQAGPHGTVSTWLMLPAAAMIAANAGYLVQAYYLKSKLRTAFILPPVRGI